MIATSTASFMLETIDLATVDKTDANYDDMIMSLYETFPDDQDMVTEIKTYTNAYASLINTVMTMDCMLADYARVKLMKLLDGFRENIMFIASKLDGVPVTAPDFHSDDDLLSTLGSYVPEQKN